MTPTYSCIRPFTTHGLWQAGLMLLILPFPTWSQEQTTQPAPEQLDSITKKPEQGNTTAETDKTKKTLLGKDPLEPDYPLLNQTEDSLSVWVHDVGEYVDHRLGKKEDDKAITNRSYIRLSSQTHFTRQRGLYFEQGIALRFDLPYIRRNWKLLLESDPQDYNDLESKQRQSDATNPNSRDFLNEYSSQLTRGWRSNYDIGIKTRLPLDPFMRARFNRVTTLSENWTWELKQQFFIYQSKGLGSLSETNFYYPMDDDKKKIFEIDSSAQYLYDEDQWELLAQTKLSDRISSNSLMVYSLGISTVPKNTFVVSNSWISVSWKHKLYKDWLYLSVTPQIDAPIDYDYHLNPGIVLSLEAFFSKNRRIDRLNRSIPLPTTTP